MAQWRDPGLLLSQTCGLPFRAHLHAHVQLVATPDYALPGCPPGHYCSVLVARADDGRDLAALAREGIFAVNDYGSQSGWAAPNAHPGFGHAGCVLTGGHAASARAVAEGRADFAAIDAQSWRLLGRHGGATGLRELARTAPTPGLPLITARGRDAASLRAALEAIPEDILAALDIKGFAAIPAGDYLALPLPPSPK